MRASIREYSAGMTVLIAAQRVSSVSCADVIYVMDDGMVVASGSHEELLSSCPRYAHIYASQTGGEDNE